MHTKCLQKICLSLVLSFYRILRLEPLEGSNCDQEYFSVRLYKRYIYMCVCTKNIDVLFSVSCITMNILRIHIFCMSGACHSLQCRTTVGY